MVPSQSSFWKDDEDRGAGLTRSTRRAGPKLVGAGGFEPPDARSKVWCLTTWRRPSAKPGAGRPRARDVSLHGPEGVAEMDLLDLLQGFLRRGGGEGARLLGVVGGGG